MNKKYLTIKEAAEYSGLSKWTLYRLSCRREIPMLKIGSRVLIPKDEFEVNNPELVKVLLLLNNLEHNG